MFGSHFTDFGIGSDEKFVGEGDADDHLFFTLCDQSVAEVRHALIVFADDVSDEEENAADTGATAAGASDAGALAAVIGEGATPTILEMAPLERLPSSGRSAMSVATVRPATPLTERRTASILAQSGSAAMRLAISALKDLPRDLLWRLSTPMSSRRPLFDTSQEAL